MHLERNASPKPARGSQRRERIVRSLARDTAEDVAKREAKRRDGHCRWPHARGEKQICRRMRQDAAHYKGKGMGGNKDGSRNVPKNLISFCLDVHQGARSLHSGHRKVVPLEHGRLMNGACEFYERRYLGGRWGKWVLMGTEIAPGVLL